MFYLGGCKQPWSDVYVAGPWRIQRRAGCTSYRLLQHNRCQLRGNYDACREAIDSESLAIEQEGVVLLHGILRTARCFHPLARQLNRAGFCAMPIDYASTLLTIEQATDELQRVLEGLPEFSRIHLVGHSMGGLIIRAWFQRHAASFDLERLGRIVMLGTPNHGAELADWLSPTWPYRWMFGPAGQQLRRSDFATGDLLATPSVPFGLIAGGRGHRRGYNPFLPGDNDGTVTVDSVRLDGASDFLVVKSPHMLLMRDRRAMAAVETFLNCGQFQEKLT